MPDIFKKDAILRKIGDISGEGSTTLSACVGEKQNACWQSLLERLEISADEGGGISILRGQVVA